MILMHEDKMIAGLVPEEGGGGGHVIQDASGTAVAQEPTMQFADSHVSNDSTNEKTVIENIKPVTGAQFDVVTEDGFYAITDEDDATMEDTSADYVEVTADGVKTLGTLMSDFYSLIDFSKVTENSYIKLADRIYRYNTSDKFVCILFSNTEIFIADICISSTTADCGGKTAYYNGTTWQYIDNNDNVFGDGIKITLYYGTDSCVTNLINQAKYTYMENGESVESALSNLRGTEYRSNTMVNISSYDSNENCYVTPSEGYIRVETSGDAVFMNGAGIIESSGTAVSVYVHKWAKVYGKNGNSNASSLRFIPLK